jgi:hypothetical protein
MYNAEIVFQTESELIKLTHEKFATAEEASEFAIDFVKPYIEKYKIADGQWRVFDSEVPDSLPLRCIQIRSLLSQRADEKLS